MFLNAHEANGAYFEFNINGAELKIKAEFPSTLRPALLNKFPELKENFSKDDFDLSLFRYLSDNIKIWKLRKLLELKKVTALEQTNSQSAVYELQYNNDARSGAINITNTCLFEIFENQKNYHNVIMPGLKQPEFTTEFSHPDFLILSRPNKLVSAWIIPVVMFIWFGLFYNFIRYKRFTLKTMTNVIPRKNL